MTAPHTEAQPLLGLAAIPLREIHPSPNNIREHLTGIDDLAVSIRETGLIQPIIVQQIPGRDGYQIVAGHRRFAAILRIGWAKVPALIRRDMLPDEELLAMLVENGQRAGLDPIEEARALKKLKVAGASDLEIARKIGRSQSHVSGRLALLSLPVEEQEEIRQGIVGVTGMVAKARQDAGNLRPRKKKSYAGHLGPTHGLANRAKARCRQLKHPNGTVGGIACGACWESVIRADERQQLHAHAAGGDCPICGTVLADEVAS